MERKRFVLEEYKNKKRRLGRATVKRINKLLANFGSGGIYYDEIPIKEIMRVLLKFNLEVLDDCGSIFSGFLTGSKGRTTFYIAPKGSGDGEGLDASYEDTVLSLSWYRMQSGRYEIVCYLT